MSTDTFVAAIVAAFFLSGGIAAGQECWRGDCVNRPEKTTPSYQERATKYFGSNSSEDPYWKQFVTDPSSESKARGAIWHECISNLKLPYDTCAAKLSAWDEEHRNVNPPGTGTIVQTSNWRQTQEELAAARQQLSVTETEWQRQQALYRANGGIKEGESSDKDIADALKSVVEDRARDRVVPTPDDHFLAGAAGAFAKVFLTPSITGPDTAAYQNAKANYVESLARVRRLETQTQRPASRNGGAICGPHACR